MNNEDFAFRDALLDWLKGQPIKPGFAFGNMLTLVGQAIGATAPDDSTFDKVVDKACEALRVAATRARQENRSANGSGPIRYC